MNIDIGTETLDVVEQAIKEAVEEALKEGTITQEAVDSALDAVEMDGYRLFFHDRVEHALVQYVKEIVQDLERSFEPAPDRCDP